MKQTQVDCLIIGSGVAGCVYALEASRLGLSCRVLSVDKPTRANSWLAQGGVIYPQPKDEDFLLQDIIKASGFTANPTAATELIVQGRKVMDELILNHVNFDKLPNGQLDLTLEAAHSVKRIVHAKDRSGKVLTEALWQKLKPKVEIEANQVAVDLLTLSHSSLNPTDKYNPSTCIGAYVLNTETKEVSAILAKRTILATGGLGQIFSNTTNHINAYGHGISMAYRVGARIMDMEFIQFHPTTLKTSRSSRNFLISEAVRGEGAVFINSQGIEFMKDVHPDGSLAPRDIISRAVFLETLKNNRVYLDLRPVKKVKERFPRIYTECLEQGFDINKDPIPVSPSAHYSCGGIFTDMAGNTNIKRLKAIGENACTGLHGANRLASTSLLECIVMGYMGACQDAAELASDDFIFPVIKSWESAKGKSDLNLIRQDLSLVHLMVI